MTTGDTPITQSGISPLVSLVGRDAQLSQVGHLCFGLLPLDVYKRQVFAGQSKRFIMLRYADRFCNSADMSLRLQSQKKHKDVYKRQEETNTICISGIGKALVVCRSNIQFYRNSNAVRGNGLAINI